MKHPAPFVTALLLLPCAAMANDANDLDAAYEADLDAIYVEAEGGSTLSEDKQTLTTSAMQTTTGLILSPKETPQSVSVVTKAALESRGISDMHEALQTTTGVNVIPDSGQWRYQSRGFYMDKIEEDGIASTVKGSATNPFRDAQSMTDLAVYDHIEVVRGATGLTQAGGEPGGTINAVRKRPLDEFVAQGNLQFSSHAKARATADVTGALGGGWRGRLVTALENDPTFKNLPKDNKKAVIYGVVDKDIGENNTLTLGALYQQQDTTPDISGVPMGVDGAESGLGRKAYLGFDWNRAHAKKLNLFADLDTFFGEDWRLQQKISYTKNQYDTQFGFLANFDRSYTGLARGDTLNVNNLQNYDSDGYQIAYHANLTGKYRLFGRDHDLFTTYDYSRESNDTKWRRVSNSDPFDPYSFAGSEIAEPNWDENNFSRIFYHTRIYSSGFGLGTRFNAADNWRILAGARYSYWKSAGRTYYEIYGGAPDGEITLSSYKRHRVVPYLGVTYDLNPNQSLYASYTSIFKPQSRKDKDGNRLEPVVGNNYEIGHKSEWFGGKLNTAIALFQIDQKNRGVWVDDATHSNGGYYQPIGEVQSRGVDLEIAGALTDDWQIFAGYTYNKSKYKRTENSSYTEGMNFSKHTPERMLRVYSRYRLPFDNQKWTIGAGVRAQSKTNSLRNVKQGGYAVWDANVDYQFNDRLSFGLIGKNLTDKLYYENHASRALGGNNLYGEGRAFVLNVDWNF